MFKRLLIATFILALLPVWAGCGGLPQSAVAEVNGKVITREDLDKATQEYKQQFGDQGMPAEGTEAYKDFQKELVSRLVDEQILWMEAEKMDLNVTDQEIEDQINTATNQAGGEEQLQKTLDDNNMTMESFKESIRKSLLFQKIYPEVTKDAPEITDEEARAYYDANPDQFQQPEMRKVSHILVATPEEAQAVKARLDAGEDFATVAKEVSTDPGSKDKGGSLGEVPSENSGFVPEFEQAMDQLQAGETSDPVQTQFGFHIIRVESITPPGVQSFEEVLDDLKMGLMLEAQRKIFDAWLEDVRGNYDITYADEFKPDDSTTATQTPTAAE
ncbi:foldase protein PrsA 3 precursor [bacterium BMS3Abin01]|nr:foldase protein PrsA 3 precursor [bacterium BMS3Abin01]